MSLEAFVKRKLRKENLPGATRESAGRTTPLRCRAAQRPDPPSEPCGNGYGWDPFCSKTEKYIRHFNKIQVFPHFIYY
jgi:hypothetical protein